MGSNSEDLRELPDIQKPLLLFKNLKTDLDKLKSQIDKKKEIFPVERNWNTPEAGSAKA